MLKAIIKRKVEVTVDCRRSTLDSLFCLTKIQGRRGFYILSILFKEGRAYTYALFETLTGRGTTTGTAARLQTIVLLLGTVLAGKQGKKDLRERRQ